MKTQGWMYPVAGLAVAGSGYLVYSHYFRRTPADVVMAVDGAPDYSMAVVVSYKSGPPDTIQLASFNIPVSQAQLEAAGPLAFLRGALIGKTRGDVNQLVSPTITSGIGTGLAIGAGVTLLLILGLAFPIGGGIVGYSYSKPGHKLGGTALGVLGGIVASGVLGAMTSGGGAAAAAAASSAPGPAQVTPGLVGAPGSMGPHLQLRDPSLAATLNQYPGGEWKYQIIGAGGRGAGAPVQAHGRGAPSGAPVQARGAPQGGAHSAWSRPDTQSHPMAARYTPGGMGLRGGSQQNYPGWRMPSDPSQGSYPSGGPQLVPQGGPQLVPPQGPQLGPQGWQQFRPLTPPAPIPNPPRPNMYQGPGYIPPMPPVHAASMVRGDSFVAASPYYHPLGGHMARSVAASQASAVRRW